MDVFHLDEKAQFSQVSSQLKQVYLQKVHEFRYFSIAPILSFLVKALVGILHDSISSIILSYLLTAFLGSCAVTQDVKFSNRQITVNGPTPPGTGVKKSAFCATR